MCKFHKDVARDIATTPETGAFDAGKYAVALVAMAHFRIEQYAPALFTNDGFNPKTLTTPEALKALKDSGLEKPLAQTLAFRDAHIRALKEAMELTAKSCDLSMQGLNIPDILTKDGYQHCASMAPDVTRNGPFLDEAVVQLFKGYDDEAVKTWAKGALSLAEEAHKPQFEAIRMAAEFFVSQPGVLDTLRGMFENTVARVFEEAKAEDAKALKSDGCVMCGHGSRADKNRPKL